MLNNRMDLTAAPPVEYGRGEPTVRTCGRALGATFRWRKVMRGVSLRRTKKHGVDRIHSLGSCDF